MFYSCHLFHFHCTCLCSLHNCLICAWWIHLNCASVFYSIYVAKLTKHFYFVMEESLMKHVIGVPNNITNKSKSKMIFQNSQSSKRFLSTDPWMISHFPHFKLTPKGYKWQLVLNWSWQQCHWTLHDMFLKVSIIALVDDSSQKGNVHYTNLEFLFIEILIEGVLLKIILEFWRKV
jgi:hypothetical protein